jgi:hypothetical protein
MNETSMKMENTMNHLKETDVIYDASDLMKSIKDKINSFADNDSKSINGQDLHDMGTASKEMMLSVKYLINEITLCLVSSKKSTTIRNANDIIKEISDTYKMVTSQ